MRKIKAGSGNEIQVVVGGGKLKFGIGEYALITGLNYGPYPEENVSKNTRLVHKYLNKNSSVRSQELESAFASCSDKEYAWKLGLVYFVGGVLYSHDANAKVDMYPFSLVKREDDFLKYLFGTESYKRTLIRLDKDMVHL